MLGRGVMERETKDKEENSDSTEKATSMAPTKLPPSRRKRAIDESKAQPATENNDNLKPPPESFERAQRRRQMNAIHSKRKRDRQKIEIEVLRGQCSNLSAHNLDLYHKNKKLEELIESADSISNTVRTSDSIELHSQHESIPFARRKTIEASDTTAPQSAAPPSQSTEGQNSVEKFVNELIEALLTHRPTNSSIQQDDRRTFQRGGNIESQTLQGNERTNNPITTPTASVTDQNSQQLEELLKLANLVKTLLGGQITGNKDTTDNSTSQQDNVERLNPGILASQSPSASNFASQTSDVTENFSFHTHPVGHQLAQEQSQFGSFPLSHQPNLVNPHNELSNAFVQAAMLQQLGIDLTPLIQQNNPCPIPLASSQQPQLSVNTKPSNSINVDPSNQLNLQSNLAPTESQIHTHSVIENIIALLMRSNSGQGNENSDLNPFHQQQNRSQH